MKKPKKKVYLIYVEDCVQAYQEQRYEDINKNNVEELEFKKQKEIKAFIRGLEFTGWSNDFDFMFLTKEEYEKLKSRLG